ncbi:MAG TPA: type II toxin-antitoxin system VapC family toxin [Chthoniobacterales bacterium]|nr:type II toxin-antitoxin system VapC family toxin [Chthoniobacterales bacterium]
MGILIDSSVLIAWERDRVDLESQLARCADEDFAISAITASELLHGVHRASNPAQRHRREPFVEGLLARLPVISFDAVAARVHARLSAELAANGTAVGPHDLIIAATALTKGYKVTTRDERSFPRIPGLSYQRW